MLKARVLQEIRKMRFEELYTQWTEKELTMEEAAKLLGIHERTFRRWCRRYEEEEESGLVV